MHTYTYNQGETEAECAIREIQEEIGMDISDKLSEDARITVVSSFGPSAVRNTRMTLYLIFNVSEDTKFTYGQMEVSEVCTYVSVCVCVNVCMYVCMYVCVWCLCMCACARGCMQ
jgi:hypothetical protein